MFNVADYWPFDLKGRTERRRFDYTSEDGSLAPVTSIFYWDARENALIYADYDENGVWKDDWFLRYIPGWGIAEYRDDYPQSGWMATLFGLRKKLVFADKQWIGWGNLAEIGGIYGNTPKIDMWESSPPQFGTCRQAVQFEALLPNFVTRHGVIFNDVLVFTYLQAWGEKCIGGRYWMAKGVGPIAIQWLGVPPEQVKWLGVDHGKIDLVTTARIDAKVTTESLAAA